jgi:thiamine pyrophosphokinase
MISHSKYPLATYADIETVALVANGAIHDYELISSLIKTYEHCIAVDGGLLHCREMNINPDLIIGDFDSIDPEFLDLYGQVPKEKFPIDKDKTDLELAIQAINTSSIRKIGIFGAMEKRTDHALGNLHLMCRLPEKIVIETERETLIAIEEHRRVPCRPNQTVSLVPFGSYCKGVSTRGLKWELHSATFDKHFMSISNICLENEFHVSVREGSLICCLLRNEV